MASVDRRSNTRPPCKQCKRNRVFVENGYAHKYCSKRCAADSKSLGAPAQARSASGSSATSSRSSSRRQTPQMSMLHTGVIDIGDPSPRRRTPVPARRVTPAPAPADVSTCRLAGCNKQVHSLPDGRESEWCSRRHRVQAVKTGKAEACFNCKVFPKEKLDGKQSDFCSKKCAQLLFARAPAIVAVPQSHTAWENVASQFKTQWKHDGPVPKIKMIWKIYGTKKVTDRFMAYKVAIEEKIGQLGGNSRRRWHGTNRECTLGDDESETQFCPNGNCSLCSIVKTSFDRAKAQSNVMWGRFGGGIYTSATSSKANDYNGEARSRYKAMILSEVIMGNAKILTTNAPRLRQPPRGFDSVVGEPGDDLNYDESIVYRNDAIRPLFLIIYEQGIPNRYPVAER